MKWIVPPITVCCLVLAASGQTNTGPASFQALFAAGLKTNAVEEIKLVLRANPELVFATNKMGQTPLFMAARGGNAKVAEAMLAFKAKINVTDSRGDTPLHTAALWGSKDVVALLLANKAEVNARNNKGETPLQVALRYRSHPAADVLELYEESQSVTNQRGKDGSIIMRNRRDETVKLLFQHGARE